MKKICLFLSALLFSVMSFAATVTFTAGTDNGNASSDHNSADAYQIVKDGITVECSKGIATYDQYRCYKSQSVTIKSTVGNITSVVFNCTASGTAQYGPGCFTVEAGGYSYEGNVGTWTGSAEEITFTASSNQVRANSIVVTYVPSNPNFVGAPMISGEQDFVESTVVSLTADEGLKIYYTTDGAEPTNTSTEYTAPFTLTTTTTVKAVAYKAEIDTYSAVAEAQFTKATAVTCAEAAELAMQVSGDNVMTDIVYVVKGYVTEVTGEVSREQQRFWVADSPSGDNVLHSYFCNVPKSVEIGNYVQMVGKLTKYGTTPQMKNGDVTILDENSTLVNITGLQYADAYYYEVEGVKYYEIDLYNDQDPDTYDYIYPELYIGIAANSKTALNGTYDLLLAGYWTSENDSVMQAEASVGSVTIKNVDEEGNYSFVGSYVGTDEKTYNFDQTVNVYASDVDNDFAEITLQEEAGEDPGQDPVTPPTGPLTFDADVDKGNAETDYNDAAAFEVSKNGVTLAVSEGIIGTYNNECHYRIYKSQTLTVTSTVGAIAKIEFTCTANDTIKYGPGCFAVDGEYNYSGAVGTWTGSANEVVFTASSNQVRATQIVVTLEGASTDVENVVVSESAEKVMKDGQLFIIRDDKVYNILGAQVK